MIGISNQGSRASLNCNLFGGDSASAQCLRFGELWYDVFAIGTAFSSYQIAVNVNMTTTTSAGADQSKTETIVVSPEQLIQTSTDGEVIARLIGDFSPFQQYPVLSEKYLMVPSQPLNNPRVSAGIINWMFIDKNDAELDGTVCNKIGVSFEGFRTENGACENAPGSCLRNQLEDFYQRDDQKRQRGQVNNQYSLFFPLC